MNMRELFNTAKKYFSSRSDGAKDHLVGVIAGVFVAAGSKLVIPSVTTKEAAAIFFVIAIMASAGSFADRTRRRSLFPQP